MTLQADVEAELRRLRKTQHGLTVEQLVNCPVICSLLSDGTPAVAYNAIKTGILDAASSPAVSALAASLRLSVDRDTHLDRLNDWGMEHGCDQRTARRRSDAGVKEVAAHLVHHWSTAAVPHFQSILLPIPDGISYTCIWSHHVAVEMGRPYFYVRDHAGRRDINIASVREERGLQLRNVGTVVELPLSPEGFSFTAVWRGELWPRFTASLVAGFSDVTFQVDSVGAKQMITARQMRSPICGDGQRASAR